MAHLGTIRPVLGRGGETERRGEGKEVKRKGGEGRGRGGEQGHVSR